VGAALWLGTLWQGKQRGPVRHQQHRRRQLRRQDSTVAEMGRDARARCVVGVRSELVVRQLSGNLQ
jgi:hypothetical protein